MKMIAVLLVMVSCQTHLPRKHRHYRAAVKPPVPVVQTVVASRLDTLIEQVKVSPSPTPDVLQNIPPSP